VLAPAFSATSALSRGQAFRAWFLGGIAYNTVMYWWIWNVMKVGPVLVVGLGLVLLIAFLSLFNGLLGWGFITALQSPRRHLLLPLYPLAWAGLEAARAVGEMSFPWNNLGYTLGNFPVLFQTVSLWGIYGLSAAMIAANLLLFLCLRAEGRARRALFAAFATAPLLLLAHGIVVLSRADDSRAPRMDISLVQPSIPQTRKWDETYFAEVMAKTFRVMGGPEPGVSPVLGSDLIVLAETAVPDFLRARDDIRDSLKAVAAASGSPLLIGALDFVTDRRPWGEYRFYNSAFLFPPDTGIAPAQYSKLRLVPFSEKLPFDGVFPVLNYVNLGEGDFSPGDGHRVWGHGARSWAPSICYEVIYPSFVREARAAGARLLVNITNDGWFGRTNGPHQHANIARFRAAENGMPVARCANTGVSVFFDAWGRDLGRTALMDSTVLRRSVPVPDRLTLYSRLGGGVDAIFLLALALWTILALFPRSTRAPEYRSTLGP
jgi:apolipoprotein N-acyltransferase